MSTFIEVIIKIGKLENQMFKYSITFSAEGKKQMVLCEIFYPLDPEETEQRVSTFPQNTELFNFTASKKTEAEIQAHKREVAGDLLSVGILTPNPKIHGGVVSFVHSITGNFGLLSVSLINNFPYLWQEGAEFHFKVSLTSEDQVKKFFQALEQTE